ncbi:hypothetical protein M514_01802 [Trichuris suis]|uniref:Metal cation transporter, ZIP family n=1 Tax=Trichuris suis TaxID=68888 RepID=A0A085MJ95_9BILA|nr:hypothetical protein M513_01802 [Trichuris suis]KFD72675.1 hypothetical protein M514_01802 [Trichuris suis]
MGKLGMFVTVSATWSNVRKFVYNRILIVHSSQISFVIIKRITVACTKVFNFLANHFLVNSALCSAYIGTKTRSEFVRHLLTNSKWYRREGEHCFMEKTIIFAGMLKLSLVLLLCCTVLFAESHESIPHVDHEHDHAHGYEDFHDHDHEAPHYKYTKEANEPPVFASRKPTTYNLYTDTFLLYFSKLPYAEVLLTLAPQHKFTRLWLSAIGSTILISVAPFLLLFFIPLSGGAVEPNQPLLKTLLAFASGSLLGDAFLHLIPHAYMARAGHSHHHDSHGHDHYHDHHVDGGHGGHDLSVGFNTLMGITAFLIVEKVVRVINYRVGDSSGHHHSHGDTAAGIQKMQVKDAAKHQTSRDVTSSAKDAQEGDRHVLSYNAALLRLIRDLISIEPSLDRKIAGYLNLAADFTHNFTDGLAVGASYLAGNTIGAVTTFTVLLHEVPHEIGDFAILVQSGCSKTKAMLLQLVTAMGALMGCCISLFSANPAELSEAASHSWVLPFTAGGFIYIATVSIIPELLEDCGVWKSIKQLMAMLFGIYMMVLISELE